MDYKYLTNDIMIPILNKQARIREGDGYTDRALLKKNKLMYDVIAEYLASLVTSLGTIKNVTASHIQDLYSQDADFLLVECYKLNYGDEFTFKEPCYACGSYSSHSFNLNELVFKMPETEDPHNPALSVTLPRTKFKVTLGLLNGHQEAKIASQTATLGGIDLNQSDYMSIRSIDGSDKFSYEDVVKLPMMDHKALREARAKLACGFDSTIKITCPSCDTPSFVNILSHRDFLLPMG